MCRPKLPGGRCHDIVRPANERSAPSRRGPIGRPPDRRRGIATSHPLAESREARKIYAGYAAIRALLELEAPTLAGDEKSENSGQWPVASGPWSDSEIHPSSLIPHPSSFIPHPSSIPPIIIDPSPTLHSPVGSFVFSHIAAAVILGIGLLIGLAWRISLPTDERQEPGGTGFASVMVGRITALADCQWSKQGGGRKAEGGNSLIPNHQSLIPIFLGDRLVLSSGLMKITYDTGAKVLLQGPCTYEIDSDRSGFLAVGRLTARVEKGSEARGQGSGENTFISLQPSAFSLIRRANPHGHRHRSRHGVRRRGWKSQARLVRMFSKEVSNCDRPVAGG